MIDDVNGILLRAEKGEELTWAEMDNNLSLLKVAVNYLLAGKFQQDFTDVEAGTLSIEHNFGLVPREVIVWKLVPAEPLPPPAIAFDRWIPVATPDVFYFESELTEKVNIEFVDAPGTIKVFINF